MKTTGIDSRTINICGIFRIPQKGFFVEMRENGKSYSISIWKIDFPSEEEANKIFFRFLGIDARKAYEKDLKDGAISTKPLVFTQVS